MEHHKARAKELLRHYLLLVGAPDDPECLWEIDDIVEEIVAAAVSEARDRMREAIAKVEGETP